MGTRKDISPKKTSKNQIILQHSNWLMLEFPTDILCLVKNAVRIKKNINLNGNWILNKVGRCEKKRISSERDDIVLMNLSRRCRKNFRRQLKTALNNQCIALNTKTMLCEFGCNSYCSRKKPNLTEIFQDNGWCKLNRLKTKQSMNCRW